MLLQILAWFAFFLAVVALLALGAVSFYFTKGFLQELRGRRADARKAKSST